MDFIADYVLASLRFKMVKSVNPFLESSSQLLEVFRFINYSMIPNFLLYNS